MKRLIALSAFLITAFICINCTQKPGNADEKFMYIVARPNAAVNQSSNCFFSTVIQYKEGGNCSKEYPSANDYFVKAGKLFFSDIAKKYNLVIEDWILKFVGDGMRNDYNPGTIKFFDSKDDAESSRDAEIKKLSNKTGGKYELIESPHTYNCE